MLAFINQTALCHTSKYNHQSVTIMQVSLLQTCNTKIDEQVNAVCIMKNSHPCNGYYAPLARLDDRPNLF